MKHLLEYIWIDAFGGIRSKNRVLDLTATVTITNLPKWNFDGSSTGQAETIESERFLKPVYMCINPFLKDIPGYLVMCAVYNDISCVMPALYNHFHLAEQIFSQNQHSDPWFGYEQEFFLFQKEQLTTPSVDSCNTQGQYYCSVGTENALGREVIDLFISRMWKAELSLYGTNAEVAPQQWEFQIGTVAGIEAAHQLWLARYILLRVAESFNLCVSFHPKPFSFMNGSGCHTNFSNTFTRSSDGFENMKKMFLQLETSHSEHVQNYGAENHKRLTGIHETSSMDKFSWSVSGRHSSVRVGKDVEENGCGYFEDRRPASNCDPYLVSSLLIKNTQV